MIRIMMAAFIVVATLSTAACSSSREPMVVTVPGDHASIQAAVDAAVPGDLILVAPGRYHEQVTVEVDNITIRGLDRNTVVLDGRHSLRSGIVVTADGVSVENLTIHSYRLNGVIFTGSGQLGQFEQDYRDVPEVDESGDIPHLERFRVSHVTTYNNGLYGIYIFQSRNGVVEHSYASGHPDSGLYVGQCDPCNTVIDNVTIENNAIGYYGTNASGDVYVVNSEFRGNRLGVAPNSQTQELLSPQRGTYVVGNLVVDNDNPEAPPIARGFYGGGIAVGGGYANYIARNRVTDHDVYGIGVVEFNPFDPEDNVIEDNVVLRNGVDLVYGPSRSVATSLGNCFAGNTFDTSYPEGIEAALPCDSAEHPVEIVELRYPQAPPGIDYRLIPAPPAQPAMPGDLESLPGLLPDQPEFPQLDLIGVPQP